MRKPVITYLYARIKISTVTVPLEMEQTYVIESTFRSES